MPAGIVMSSPNKIGGLLCFFKVFLRYKTFFDNKVALDV